MHHEGSIAAPHRRQLHLIGFSDLGKPRTCPFHQQRTPKKTIAVSLMRATLRDPRTTDPVALLVLSLGAYANQDGNVLWHNCRRFDARLSIDLANSRQ